MENIKSVNEYDIDLIVETLKKTLKIQDWNIKVMKDCNEKDVYYECRTVEANGCCSMYMNRKEAVIKLNTDSEDCSIPINNDLTSGWLYTLIHELVHIQIYTYVHFVETLIKNSYLTTLEEITVNTITKTIFNLLDTEELLKSAKLKNKSEDNINENSEDTKLSTRQKD